MKYIATLVAAAVIGGGAAAAAPPQLGKASVDKVVKAMTLEEKVHLLIGTGMAGFDGSEAVVGATRSLVPGAAGTTYPIPRLGIPAIVLADGPAGLRIDPTREGDEATYYCTHFPIGTLLASTWDTGLVESVGQAMGNEVLEYGADVLLAPALNIHRNPLCGRNFEYYSEDPLIAGKIAAAYVRGIQSNGVGTSIKHFAGNNQESNRMANNSIVSERALREIYLKGFEIAVKESDPWTVMSSYNYINGQYASESKDLLTDILRSDWGYRGTVMTDWFGGSDGAAQVTAGNDMLQPGLDKQYNSIIAAVKDGSLDEKLIDRNVKRILNLIVRTPRFKGYKYSNKPDLAAHAAVTRQSATEGMVLLKNDNNTLPLKPSCKKVALLGCTSYDFIAGGTGSGNVNRAYTVSLLEGLQNAGYQLDAKLGSDYKAHIEAERAKAENSDNPLAKFLPTPRPGEMTIDRARMADLAAANDVALITIGRNSGEFLDRTPADFDLSTAEKLLIESATQAFHSAGKQVVVVLNIGGVIETASWKDKPDAILCAWQAGQEGGNSVTDILAGRVSPSGHLTMTFPRSFVDHASSHNFPLEGAMSSFNFADHGQSTGKLHWDYTPYEEDIYVGYRYFDSFGKDVSYPFGHGLSYTTFDIANPVVARKDGKVNVTVDVRNTGTVAGKHVVQLYARAPEAKAANRPEQELKAFAKTAQLAPGETAKVTLTFDEADLAMFDAEASAWKVAPGTYSLALGSSSRDLALNVDLPVDAAAYPVARALSPAEARAKVDAGAPYVIRQKIPAGGQTTFCDAT
ncbi:MAG: glycoside hydrolase family 3 C-terminal domain-containing protein, partial [Lachnoclostridium sp.]|nr:glycoside hydrolase family 3 C-terminal domain-containing protein [Lachnoclostridium sp.]